MLAFVGEALPQVAKKAEEYFEQLSAVARARARALRMPIQSDSAEDCKSLTTRLWLFPARCHVRFYEATSTTIKYVIASHPTGLRSFKPILDKSDAKIFRKSPSHLFELGHPDFTEQKRIEAKVELAVALFLATRGVLRGLRRIEAQGKMRRTYWDREKDAMANQTSFEVTTILQASCVEAAFKDTFFAFRSVWLVPPSEPDSINFQSLSDAKFAFREQFGIDLVGLANAAMNNGWQRLHEFMLHRHRLVHGYTTEELKSTETFHDTWLVNDLHPALLMQMSKLLRVDPNVRL